MKKRPTTKGDMISTFTFILFALLLGLASLAEPAAGKSAILGLCALLSLCGAFRFKLQAFAEWLHAGRP